MNVAGWYITHHNAPLGTRLTCFALIGCTLFNWVNCVAYRRRQLSCVGEGVYTDATQLNSMSRWVELRRRSVYSDPPTQLSSTSSWVELRRYKRAFSATWHYDKFPQQETIEEQCFVRLYCGVSKISLVIALQPLALEIQTWNLACMYIVGTVWRLAWNENLVISRGRLFCGVSECDDLWRRGWCDTDTAGLNDSRHVTDVPRNCTSF